MALSEAPAAQRPQSPSMTAEFTEIGTRFRLAASLFAATVQEAYQIRERAGTSRSWGQEQAFQHLSRSYLCAMLAHTSTLAGAVTAGIAPYDHGKGESVKELSQFQEYSHRYLEYVGEIFRR